MLPGIHEGADLDEFGDMEATVGTGDGRVVSSLLGRELDTSLQEAQDTSAMKAEITRCTEAQVVRHMSMFQKQFTGAHDGQWEDPRGLLHGQGREAQYADVDITLKDRPYPPSPFDRAGASTGLSMTRLTIKLFFGY